jgi:hypothetical protein
MRSYYEKAPCSSKEALATRGHPATFVANPWPVWTKANGQKTDVGGKLVI